MTSEQPESSSLVSIAKRLKSSLKGALQQKGAIQQQVQSVFKPERGPVYLGGYQALTRTLWGHKMFVDTQDVAITPHLLLDGYWEMWITNFLMGRVREGMTVIEIGTNLGYYTVLLTALIGDSGKLHGFEASSKMYDFTHRNLEVNGLLRRAALNQKAVFSQSKTLQFSCFKHHPGGSTVAPVSQKSANHLRDEVEVVEVEAISLDDYFGSNVPKVDLLKVDAEGSEAHIFKGMERVIQANPQLEIIFEFAQALTRNTGETPEGLIDFLQGYGYKLHVIQTDSTAKEVSREELLTMQHCEVFACR